MTKHFAMPVCPKCGEDEVEEVVRVTHRTPLNGAMITSAGTVCDPDWGVSESTEDYYGTDDIVCIGCDYAGTLQDFFARVPGVVTPGSGPDDPAVVSDD